MTLWPRHNWTLIRGQRRSTPQGTGWCAIKHATAAWKVPLKESSLPEPSSVTLRVILWTPSGPCAPWGASGPATTSPGPPSPSSSSSEILQNEEGTLKKARPRFYKEWDSTKTEILQRTRFYKERDSTKNEILQRTRFSRTRRALWRKPDRDSTPSGPSAPWGASGPAATSPGPPSPSSSSSPGLTPLLPSLQTHSIGSIGPGPCVSQDAQDAHQRPQRRGNKEVLELVLGSRWYPQPLNAANERQSSGDETRTSWDELRRGHHNMIWERS